MQIKQKLSKQIMSLSNGYINKGPQRATVMLPNPEERLQKPTCKPQAHNVLEILSCQSIYDCFSCTSSSVPSMLSCLPTPCPVLTDSAHALVPKCC